MFDALIVAIYIFSVICVGIYYSRGISSMREFSLADRKFPMPVIMSTISATFIGADFIFGFAQQSFSIGMIFLFPLLGLCLCKVVIAYSVVPRVAKFEDAFSAGDIMARDYGTIGRIVTGLSGTIISIGFVGAQVAACTILFKYFFGVPNVLGFLVACSVIVIYSALGGFRAVAFTDMLQFGVLLVALPIICNFELSKIGGITAILSAMPESHFSPSTDVVFDQVAWFFFFLLPLLDPGVLQRIIMDRDHRKVAQAFKASALTDIPIYLIICVIGLIALVKNPDIDAGLAFAEIIGGLPTGIKGLAIAGVLAVFMSTADSYLNVASISLVHDVIKPIFKNRLSEKTELRLAQSSTAVIGVFAIYMSLSFPSILDLIVYFQNLSWAPLIVVPLYASIFGLRANAVAFVASGVAGVSIQYIWPAIFGTTPEIWMMPLSLCASTTVLLATHFGTGGRLPERSKDRKNGWRLNFADISKKLGDLLFAFSQYSPRRVTSFGASYSLFGFFAVLNYIMPVFMWSNSDSNHFGLHLVMRFLAAALCFGLLINEYWPLLWRRYLPYYWHGTLLYCLPFYATFMLLDNNCSHFWLCNMVLTIFLLASLVDWLSFSVLLVLGGILGYGVCIALGTDFSLVLDAGTLYVAMYMYVFAALIGILFSRRQEKITQEKLAALRILSSSIAHEMRTPLATIAINAQVLAKNLPKYQETYALARKSLLPIPFISDNDFKNCADIPDRINEISGSTQDLINMLLLKMGDVQSKSATLFSVRSCIERALVQYPIKTNQKCEIIWDKKEDFSFVGNDFLFIHVIFNLIQNSLTAVSTRDVGEIKIWIEKCKSENRVHFYDNGVGIPKHIQNEVFSPFVSATEGGTGLGLVFCKMVMKGFDGDIIYKPLEECGTEMVLIFPKVKEEQAAQSIEIDPNAVIARPT